MLNVAKIYSVLGNPKSLVPLAVKDAANCVGLTGTAYVTGKKEEAQDRFIDEAGTEALWIGGIPVFKTVIDNTVFKATKFDSKYDIRNLENPEIYKKTIEYAPEKYKGAIQKIGENKKIFKGLNITKAVASIGLAMLTYYVLTDVKQKYTDKKLEEKIRKELAEKKIVTNNISNQIIKQEMNASSFGALKKHNKDLSFKGGLSNFILDPVKNMYVLDGGITGQRLAKSRDKQEFMGYAIKEGGFLFFMYYLGQKIQDFMVNRAETKFNKSIELDARVLEDNNFKSMFTSGKLQQDLDVFAEFNPEPTQKKGVLQKVKDFFNPPKLSEAQMKSDAKLYEELLKPQNKDNILVKTAKQSDIIETFKERQKGFFGFFKKKVDTGVTDTRKFIDLNSVKETKANIQKLYEQYKASGQDVDTFFNQVRKLKRSSVRTNILASMFALGVVLPGLMLAKRIMSNDTEFASEKRMREKLEKESKQMA